MIAPVQTGRRQLVAVATRIAREPTEAEAHALSVAIMLRSYAARAFGSLEGVRYKSDQSRVFGELLACRSAVAMIGFGLPAPTRAKLAAVEAEIDRAVKWSIEAGLVCS